MIITGNLHTTSLPESFMSLGTHLATFLRGLGYCHHHSAIHTELRINPIMSGIRIPAVMFSKHRKMQIFYFFTDSWFWSKKMRQKYISSFFERIAWQWEIQFNSIYFDFILFDPKKITHNPIMSCIRIPAVIFKGQIISKRFFPGRGFSQKTNGNMSHTSKNEFIRSFFGRILGLTICFWY